MTLAMFIVLVGLGTWQVERLAWKTRVLADIARSEAAAASPLTPTTPPFAKVSVSGHFLYDRPALFGAEVRQLPSGPEMGARQIVPLARDGGDPILVDRGWVPDKRTHPVVQPEGEVTVVGYLHPPEAQGMFSASDDVVERRFYTMDPEAIGAALGLSRVAPFVIVALGSAPTGEWPEPAQHLPRPPNNHLVYAITWYGLAAALVAVFVVWARRGTRA
jgi:surfeit locus 1 family protein